MTFEEFKQQFEIFSKTDTPAKLAICEKQYQQYLKQKEDADYFEPFDDVIDNEDWLSGYQKNLYQILGFDKIDNDQFHLLIQPSFEPEHLLSINRSENGYTSTVVMPEDSYWCLYRDNLTSSVKPKISSVQLDEVIGDQIFLLIEQSIIQARKPQSGYITLDGTVYKLSKIIDGARRNVSKHSPDQNSKTGRIIEFLIAIVDFTKDNSMSHAEIEIKIKSLISSI